MDPSLRVPTRSRPPAGFVPSRKTDGIRRSIGWPISSSAAQPNITSTARFAKTSIPRASAETMPCVAVSSSVRSVRSCSSSRRAWRASSVLRRSVMSSSSPVSRVTWPVGVAIGSSQTLHPSHGSIRAQDTVCVIPRILRLQNLFEYATHRADGLRRAHARATSRIMAVLPA